MLEKIIIDIVQNYKFTKLKAFIGDIEKRDFFLFVLFCRLINKSQDSVVFKFAEINSAAPLSFETLIDDISSAIIDEKQQSGIRQAVEVFLSTTYQLSRKALPKGMFATLTKLEQNEIDNGLRFTFSDILAPDDNTLFFKLLSEIKLSLVGDIKSAIDEILAISSLNAVDFLTTFDAIEVYSRVLTRLQATNVSMQFEEGFQYEEIPSDFMDLIFEIADLDSSNSIYAPFEITAEQSLYAALEYPDKEIRIESMGQSTHHLLRKFALAQAKNIHCSYTYCLSNNSTVKKNYYDTSICLLQPKMQVDKITDTTIEQSERKHVTYKEHLYIKHMIECLNPYGKGYMVMGKGPLFRRKEKEERKLLIENNWVDAVITLPSKLMTFCPIPLVLLVINKGKYTNDVLFINASEFQKEGGNRSTIDNIDKLAQEFKSRPLYSPISFTVSNHDIAENNYSINSLNYLTNEETQQYNLHELSITRKNLLEKLNEKHSKIEKLLDAEN
ncbi:MULTISPECIES: N-6 DNA methylase [Colwelliaceae]|uniref:site-specific DNA-methyltransferase (adenine-specific) n=2 Tax=Colwelliaceae TaxID=267889 RepID=A0A7X0NEJ4_9GAMM|nr:MULTISPECIES: N-6 DNA methylase [Colwelliaceae]MBB6541984.1 hypothetical protein [Thalassotalea piscium]SEL87160.1 N-6 DNA Methylase [Colwellia chukchiensis]